MSKPHNLYPEFGKLFSELLANHLPHDVKTNGYQISRMLNLPAAEVNGWLKGRITGKQGLSPNRLLQVLEALMSREQYLFSYDDVETLVKLGRDDYRSILRAPSIQDLRRFSLPTLDTSHPYITRQDLEQELLKKLETISDPILVYGPSGRGKKTLIQRVVDMQKSSFALPTILMHGETVEQLTEWISLLLLSMNQKRVPLGMRLLLEDFRRLYDGRTVLFVLFDCQDAEVIELMEKYLPSTCKLIVSTHELDIVNSVPPKQRVAIPCFSVAETQQYLQSLSHGANPAAPEVEAFHHLTMGNPLTTRIAASRLSEIDLNELIEALHVPGSPDPANELTGLHRAIQLAYKSLPTRVQTAFAQIGLLPAHVAYDLLTLRSVWSVDGEQPLFQGEAKEILRRLAAQAGLADQVSMDEWSIHPVVLGFAKNAIPTIEKDVQAKAEKWFSISLADAEAQREYQAALGEAHTKWKTNTGFMERVLSQFVSPLPHTLPLILRSFRSLATSSNIDTWNILVKHKTFFSSREFRQLEFSRQAIQRSWRPYQFFVGVLLLGILFLWLIGDQSPLHSWMLGIACIVPIGTVLYGIYDVAKTKRQRTILMRRIWHMRVHSK
jgi:hypothetical protein